MLHYFKLVCLFEYLRKRLLGLIGQFDDYGLKRSGNSKIYQSVYLALHFVTFTF